MTAWTSPRRRRVSSVDPSARAEQVLEGELVQPDEAEGALACGVRVEVLEGTAVRQQVGHGLTGREGRLGELADAGLDESFLHLGVGAEREGPLLEQQVHPHVRRGGVPDTLV